MACHCRQAGLRSRFVYERCGRQNALDGAPVRHRAWSRLIFTRSTHMRTPDGLSVRKGARELSCGLTPGRSVGRFSKRSSALAARLSGASLRPRRVVLRRRHAQHGCVRALTFARHPAEPRPKTSCLHVASGRHGASRRRASGFEGCRPPQVAVPTRRFLPTLQRPIALLPTRTRPSSVRADGRAHELHFTHWCTAPALWFPFAPKPGEEWRLADSIAHHVTLSKGFSLSDLRSRYAGRPHWEFDAARRALLLEAIHSGHWDLARPDILVRMRALRAAGREPLHLQ